MTAACAEGDIPQDGNNIHCQKSRVQQNLARFFRNLNIEGGTLLLYAIGSVVEPSRLIRRKQTCLLRYSKWEGADMLRNHWASVTAD